MAWIRIEDGEHAAPELAELLRTHSDPVTGRVDEILRVHSIGPRGLAAHLALYTSAMRPTPGLRTADRELIAVVVSEINGCHY